MDGAERTAVGEAAAETARGTLHLWSELALLFLGAPTLLIVFRHHVNGLIIPLLVVAALVCGRVLRRDAGFDRRALWNAHDFGRQFGRTLAVFLPLGAVMTAFSWWFLRGTGAFLVFPRAHPFFWALVMVLYPVLSAYPQEVVYRAFFFRRYRGILGEGWAALVLSALLFGAAHAFLGNWIAPLFASLGGLLFGRTYRRSGSVLQAALEHGLWGDLLFTLGTGWFFYAGSI